jgi:dTDP-4-dehydrorhamnose 3,5-epimerase-like enzyme
MSVEINYQIDLNSGKLGIIEFKKLNFSPRRLYWISDLIPGSIRGNHAHKTLRQAMFVIAGSINIKLYEGDKEIFRKLEPSGQVLYIEPGIWREFWTDEPGSVVFVLCDQPFNESDYIRDFHEYIAWFKAKNEC